MKAPLKALLPATIAAALASMAAPVLAEGSDSFLDSVKNGDVKLNFRLRYEDVEAASDNDALTLRSRLTYKTADYNGFSAMLEMDDVTIVGDKDFSGIADPEGTEVNQAWFAYDFGKNNVKYGRQRINLDNQRFVGGVGFRQNEQTFDAVSFTNTSLENTKVFVANVNNVNRIFGEDSAIGDHENDTYLVNFLYDGFKAGKLSLYSYQIENLNAAHYSTDTYGVRFAGKQGAQDATQFSYVFEYAQQSDAANNPNSYTADYLLLEGGVKTKPFGLTVGYEVMGADDGDTTAGSLTNDGRFITPLATLHKFQGWTDTFLAGGTGNIDTGVQDFYVAFDTKLAGFKFKVVYHNFTADNASATVDDLGTELGFLVARKVNDNLSLSLKYADYSADDFGTDTEKLWLTANMTF